MLLVRETFQDMGMLPDETAFGVLGEDKHHSLRTESQSAFSVVATAGGNAIIGVDQ